MGFMKQQSWSTAVYIQNNQINLSNKTVNYTCKYNYQTKGPFN